MLPPTPMTGEEPGYDFAMLNKELDKVKSQVFLGKNAAFMAPLLCAMDFQWSTNMPVTAMTDGTCIYWHPEDFLRLTPGMRISTLLHEIGHTAYLTWLRQGGRDMEYWNQATDYVINNDLKADGYEIEEPYFIYNPAFKDLPAEDIYDRIYQQKQCAPWGGGGQDPGDPSNGSGQPTKGDQPSLKGDMLPAPGPAKQQQIINAVVQAATAAILAGKPGAIPGSVQETLKKILSPVVPWERLLHRFLDERIQDDWTWQVPDRRYQGIYLPSMDSDDRLTHLIFYFDVSGSITQQIADRCFSEIHHIKKRFNPEKLTVVQFDTRITDEKTYTEDDDFNELVIIGRGGTCLREVRKHMLEHRPTCAVVFSDLYVDPMQPGPKNPILWIAVDNKQATVPFGTLVHIKP